jgi:hypothetical protein
MPVLNPTLIEDIEWCHQRWGQPTEKIEADEAALERMRFHVPQRLIDLWREFGFSVYQNGLMTIVNPMDWKSVTDEWIVGTDLFELDTFIPIFKGAYGDFQLFGIHYGLKASLMPTMGAYVCTGDKAEHGLDIATRSMFGGNEINEYDFYANPCKFEEAFNMLGPLKASEMYGFVPALPLSGEPQLKNLQKLDAFAHLSILRQLTDEVRGIMSYEDIYR